MNDTLANGTNSTIPSYLPEVTVVHSIKLMGLPINSYVLWLILRGAGGTITSEFFYLNLTVSVILSNIAEIFHIAWIFTHSHILSRLVVFTFVVFYLFSVPWFQCCVCVERYVAVVHPVVFLRYKALRYRVACCCAVWLMTLAFGLVRLFSNLYPYYFLLVTWVVCISVLCFCCLAVLRALKQPGPGEGRRDTKGGEGNDLKKRAFRIILISLVVMSVTIMSYIPLILFLILSYSNRVALTITYSIGVISTFSHPLLYLHKVGKLPCFK